MQGDPLSQVGAGHRGEGAGVGPPSLWAETGGKAVQVSPQEMVPRGLPCLGLGPTACSSGEDTWVEGACGPEGRGQGKRASGCIDAVPPPREKKVAKAGPD